MVCPFPVMNQQMNNKKTEGVDYELIPSEENEKSWNVRILKGDFVETIIQYGAIRFNEDEDNLNFNFFVISSPDENLTEKNEYLQYEAASILGEVLEGSLENSSIGMKNAED